MIVLTIDGKYLIRHTGECESMAPQGETVLVQREKGGKQTQGWVGARLNIDAATGMIALAGTGIFNKFSMTVRPDQVQTFGIDLISDTNTLAIMYGGGLLGYGIAALMGRWVKLPVIAITQSSTEPDSSWVRIRSAGWGSRGKTRTLAQRIANALTEHGYRGMQPNLNDETLWKTNYAAMAGGCLLVIVALFIILAVVVLASN
jgi:hypothetical protein